jgi:hypothetical protein
VSVVCSNALNRAVIELELTDPGKILDKVTELVCGTFKKSHNVVNDGMDISLCAFNLKTKEVSWAGANNPLWYISSFGGNVQSPESYGEGDEFRSAIESELKQPGILHEITANKQPVGKSDYRKPFTTHTLQLNKGDILYLFTDGYADQFGGARGKKFKYKQLGDLLVSIHQKPVKLQRDLLDKAFEEWRGVHDQVDDVCIIGIRI